MNEYGLLWAHRSELSNWLDDQSISKSENSEVVSYIGLELGDLFDEHWEDNYSKSIEKDVESELIRGMSQLSVLIKEPEDESEKSLDHHLSGEVLEYLELLGKKLDEDGLPNLFRQSECSPVVNLIAHMLKNNKLKTSFDFERALERRMNGTHPNSLRWSHELLNRLGGSGTTASAIFLLKEQGVYQGLKRRNNKKNDSSKFPRLTDMPGNLSMDNVDSEGQNKVFNGRLSYDLFGGGITVKTKRVKTGKSPKKCTVKLLSHSSKNVENGSHRSKIQMMISSHAVKNINKKQSSMQLYDDGAKNVQVSIDHALPGCSPHADGETKTVCNDTNDKLTLYAKEDSAGRSNDLKTNQPRSRSLSVNEKIMAGNQLKIGGFLVNRKFTPKVETARCTLS